MDKLRELMMKYEELIGKNYCYELVNNSEIEVIFKEENFPHIIGLHKLLDIKELNRLNKKTISGKNIYKKLKQGKIKNELILSSYYYKTIENRFKYFFKIEDLVFERVIYDFDRTKLRSKIKADLVLYTIEDELYIQLFLVKNNKGYYVPMTFIVEYDDRYVRGQVYYNIKRLSIMEKGKEYEEYIYLDKDNEIIEYKDIEVAVSCENVDV